MNLPADSKKEFFWIDYLKRSSSLVQLQEKLESHHPLINVNSLKKINIVGIAEEGQRLLNICDCLGIEVENLCDDNPSILGTQIGHHRMRSSDCLNDGDKEIPVVIASHRVLELTHRLRARGYKSVVPFALLQVLASDNFPPHMFYDGWLEALFNHQEKLGQLMALLNDCESLEVLNAVIGFRLTLDPEILNPIIDWSLYGPDFLNFSENEVYIDGGCFDGDTINYRG